MKKMQLIYGTGNPAKLGAMRRRLAALPVEILGLADIKDQISEDAWKKINSIEEDGKTPLENARKKAQVYFQVLQRPVFSCDSGLYFENVPEEVQPGVHVRTIGGKYLSDEEVEAHYRRLAERYGDLKARYRNAICLISGEGGEYSSMDESLASSPFLITSVPHSRPCNPGFPLDRISKDINSGRYFYDLSEEDVDQVAVEEGFLAFFQNIPEIQTHNEQK